MLMEVDGLRFSTAQAWSQLLLLILLRLSPQKVVGDESRRVYP